MVPLLNRLIDHMNIVMIPKCKNSRSPKDFSANQSLQCFVQSDL